MGMANTVRTMRDGNVPRATGPYRSKPSRRGRWESLGMRTNIYDIGARPMTPPIIAMANQKGGVGKTTSTLLSASSLANRGFNVLVLDMDQQGNSTTALLGAPRVDERT